MGLLAGFHMAGVAAAEVRFVDRRATGSATGRSWADAFPELRDALNDSLVRNGTVNEIRVAAGIYHPAPPDGDRTETFRLRSGLALYGGFLGTETSRDQRNPDLNATILSGDLAGEDDTGGDDLENSYHVVTAEQVDETAVLDGFVITAGNADGDVPHNTGGGVNVFEADPTLRNCKFIGNAARGFVGNGGGLASFLGRPLVIRCDFRQNYAERQGGAVFCSIRSARFIACRFIDNTADRSGGGVYHFRRDLTFEDCLFEGNRAINSGGALHNREGNAVVTRCTFRDNTGIRGGAFFNEEGGATIVDGTFETNRATIDGGAIYDSRARMILTDCTFLQNRAGRDGGALYGQAAAVTRCTFRQNTAGEDGGALFDTAATVTHCIFLGNEAGIYGGGVHVRSQRRPILANCIMVGNTAAFGAGVYNDGFATLVNCTVSGNVASLEGAGFYNASFGTPTLTNCIVWKNGVSGADVQDAQIRIAGGTPRIDYCCIEGWTGRLGGEGNIGEDPQFESTPIVDGQAPSGDAVFGDLHLRPGSPCIDAAANEALPVDTADLDGDGNTNELLPLDFDGNRRRQGCIVDMGAFEFGAFDSPADADCDTDVDLADYIVMLNCFTGSDVPHVRGCAPADFDNDGDVDLADLLAFEATFTGPR